jgi:hypothetical protein
MFVPIVLGMQIIPVILASFIVLLIAKIIKKESFKKNIIKLFPFYVTLLSVYIIFAAVWDRFIEGSNKIFFYWD